MNESTSDARQPHPGHFADCLFCEAQRTDRARIVEENALAYATRDAYPVTSFHTLFIPKRHTIDYFGCCDSCPDSFAKKDN
jgi:galactose-1-phosphate uridylyltransferase